jgi:hypothetical protein
VNGMNFKILLGAFFTWLVPLIVSFGLYDPTTNIYFPNFVGFKLIMVLLAAIACYFSMRWISKTQVLTVEVPTAYVVLNSILDLLVLVAAFKVPVSVWVTTVFPAYVLVFGIIYLIIAKRD